MAKYLNINKIYDWKNWKSPWFFMYQQIALQWNLNLLLLTLNIKQGVYLVPFMNKLFYFCLLLSGSRWWSEILMKLLQRRILSPNDCVWSENNFNNLIISVIIFELFWVL